MPKAFRAIVLPALAIAIPVVWALVSLTPFASGPVAYAQTTGIIAGTVEYHDGTLLSGATVTSTKASDSSTAEATTDSSGAFSISSLAAGSDYSISVTYGTTTSLYRSPMALLPLPFPAPMYRTSRSLLVRQLPLPP